MINLGGLLYITERKGGVAKAQDALALIRRLPIEILPADEQAIFAAARIKANYAISYAGSFVVAQLGEGLCAAPLQRSGGADPAET
jgi:predicted nucleic acid-binding protein